MQMGTGLQADGGTCVSGDARNSGTGAALILGAFDRLGLLPALSYGFRPPGATRFEVFKFSCGLSQLRSREPDTHASLLPHPRLQTTMVMAAPHGL